MQYSQTVTGILSGRIPLAEFDDVKYKIFFDDYFAKKYHNLKQNGATDCSSKLLVLFRFRQIHKNRDSALANMGETWLQHANIFYDMLFFYYVCGSCNLKGDVVYRRFPDLMAQDILMYVEAYVKMNFPRSDGDISAILLTSVRQSMGAFLGKTNDEECGVALRASIIQTCLYISFLKKIDPRIPLNYLKYKCKLYVIRYGTFETCGGIYNTMYDAFDGYSNRYDRETRMFWEGLERDVLEEYASKTSFSYLPKKAGLTVGAAGLAEYMIGSAFPVASLATGAALVGYRSWHRSLYTELNLAAKLEIIADYCAMKPYTTDFFGCPRAQVENMPQVLLPHFNKILQECFNHLKAQRMVPEYRSTRSPRGRASSSSSSSSSAHARLPDISLGLFDDVVRQRVRKTPKAESGKGEETFTPHKYGVELSLINPPPPGLIHRIFYSSQSGTIGVLEYRASQMTDILNCCPHEAQKAIFQNADYVYSVLAATRDFNGVKFEGSNMCRLKFFTNVGPYFVKTDRKAQVQKTKAGQAPRIITAPVYKYVGDKKH